MRPHFADRMCGATARVARYIPSTLTSNTRRQSSTESCSNGVGTSDV
jgi:hypothetical protein